MTSETCSFIKHEYSGLLAKVRLLSLMQLFIVTSQFFAATGVAMVVIRRRNLALCNAFFPHDPYFFSCSWNIEVFNIYPVLSGCHHPQKVRMERKGMYSCEFIRFDTGFFCCIFDPSSLAVARAFRLVSIFFCDPLISLFPKELWGPIVNTTNMLFLFCVM